MTGPLRRVVWLVHCPECNQQLRVRDYAIFGKTVRCPECRHAFVLEEPMPAQSKKTPSETASLPDLEQIKDIRASWRP